MTLHLGAMTTVVISSDEVARAIFKHHNVVLAGRKIYESMKGDIGNEGSLITAQYGPHWRMLHRLCTGKFFAVGPVDAQRGVRAKCIEQLVQNIRDTAVKGGDIDISQFFFLMAFNLIGNLIFSKDLLDPNSERGAEFFYHARKATEFAGKPNVADFLPVVRWEDPQGIRKGTQMHVKLAFNIAGEFLRERMREKGDERGGRKITWMCFWSIWVMVWRNLLFSLLQSSTFAHFTQRYLEIKYTVQLVHTSVNLDNIIKLQILYFLGDVHGWV
ncbi:hypothetical protein ACS0TY_016274 [Phlomoides rotata]